jgi:hypothetical protein
LYDTNRFFEDFVYLLDLLDGSTPYISCGSGYSNIIWRRFEGNVDI